MNYMQMFSTDTDFNYLMNSLRLTDPSNLIFRAFFMRIKMWLMRERESNEKNENIDYICNKLQQKGIIET